jgi:hypothetical protein
LCQTRRVFFNRREESKKNTRRKRDAQQRLVEDKTKETQKGI